MHLFRVNWWARPNGWRPLGKPRTHWRGLSWLAWECLGNPPKELVRVQKILHEIKRKAELKQTNLHHKQLSQHR